jgi:hypothetical protein
MYSRFIKFTLIVGVIAIIPAISVEAKPLKVFILAGQSNMQGKARENTFKRIGMTPDGVPLLKEMQGPDGKPRVMDDVYISFMTGWGKTPVVERQGKLALGFGTNSDQIGPEFSFGIYMHKLLNEPILLIKTAWGGKSLHTDFLSPSGTALREGKQVGEFYTRMIEHVNKVLADPGKFHPAYDKEAGYEIAGFVWFQGWNDMVNKDPYKENNEHPEETYALYSKLLTHFIRDVRKDLKAPAMPFVIGVLGVDGPMEDPLAKQQLFRNAMAAPAAMPEFKDNVAAVLTEKYWDMESKAIQSRVQKTVAERVAQAWQENPSMKGPERSKLARDLLPIVKQEILSEKELGILTGQSNGGYHYDGSAYIIGRIGKAFAEAIVDLKKN